MYMGVIPAGNQDSFVFVGAPHVYGGDPFNYDFAKEKSPVLPMYMGVILWLSSIATPEVGAPHVYGGDPRCPVTLLTVRVCSQCIWG